MHSDAAALLRERGLHATAQRVATLGVVAAHPHATAELIEREVRAQLGSVSRQGVYDALHALVDAGLLRRIQPMGSPALYEDRVADNHHHLICRDCACVVDVDCAVGATPCLTAADDAGFTIDEADVAYWGRCPQCQGADASRVASIDHLPEDSHH